MMKDTNRSEYDRTLRLAFLIPDQAWSSTAISPAEIFHALAMNPSVFRYSRFSGIETRLLRCSEREISGFSGITSSTTYFGKEWDAGHFFDALVIPSVWDLSMQNLKESSDALVWLSEQHAAGAIVAGLVTGVFFLGEAGLLNDREATVHWASINHFKQRYPKVKVSPQLQLIEADRVITTSTTPATFDVALMLIQRFLGDRAAEYAADYFRIREKDAPLPKFLEPSCNDTLVDAARDLMRVHYASDTSLANLAEQLNVTSRTLSRRFMNATGISPIQYLTRQRLNAARSLLKSTDLQIQRIADQTGFGSATVFCRNFHKAYGQSPRAYREHARPRD